MPLLTFKQTDSRVILRAQYLAFFAWLGLTAFGLTLTPNPAGHGTHRQIGLMMCPSVVIFDRPCPGCGLTTSITNLLHGHFSAAFANNLMGPLLYVGFTVLAWLYLGSSLRQMRLDTSSRSYQLVLNGCLVLFFAYGIIRFLTTRYHDPQSLRLMIF